MPQPLIVLNKPGATAVIASNDVVNGKADGYKLLMLDVNAVITPNMGMTKITYEDFIPIARLNFDQSAITVRADAPWNTVEEFLAASKRGIFASAMVVTARSGTSPLRAWRTRPA